MTPGKQSQAKIAKMATLADKRLIQMLKQMEEGFDGQRGSNKELHERTGLPKETISRLLRGSRLRVEKETIDIVIAKMQISADYFRIKDLGGRTYKDFIGKGGVTVAAKTPPVDTVNDQPATVAIGAMLDALRATEAERAEWDRHQQMFPAPYLNATHAHTFVLALRRGMSVQEAIDHAVNDAAESEMRATGRRKIDKPDDSD